MLYKWNHRVYNCRVDFFVHQDSRDSSRLLSVSRDYSPLTWVVVHGMHSPVEGSLCRFQLLAFPDGAAVDTWVQVLYGCVFSFLCINAQECNGWVIWCWIKVWSEAGVAVPLLVCWPVANQWPSFSISIQAFGLAMFYLAILIGVECISLWFDCISPGAGLCWTPFHVFICHFYTLFCEMSVVFSFSSWIVVFKC